MTQSGKPTAGVLQIPAAATQKSASAAPAKKASKPPAPRLKLLVRRLPPGLTQTELETTLGDEWKVGAGKVDWLQYKPGKVSKDPAKPSRPSRAYLRVVSSEHIAPLSDTVRQASFQDAGHTSHDSVLLGPPTLEFAPYAKTPGSRSRKDARQGTIDQDPDFITFLESLTQPITKPAPMDSADGDEKKKETAVTTPLVQFIKDKKASKAKDSTGSKSSKHSRSEKESKQEKVQAKKLLQRPDKEATATDKKAKSDKPTKESAKAAKHGGTTATKTGKAGTGPSATKETTVPAAAERKRERGNVAAATKILQRDLGLSPAGGRRRGKGGSTEIGSPKNESSRDSSVPSIQGNKKDQTSKPARNTPTTSTAKSKDGEFPSSRASDAAPTPPTTHAPAKAPKGNAKAKPTPSPTPTATQAFLKHANPSQGVTEALLETAFSPFGAVLKVEIDKKKGFGYVDFAEPPGLQQAIAASPVSVAQSQVVVLERKANPAEKSPKGQNDSQSNGSKPKTEGSGSARGSRGRGSRNKASKGEHRARRNRKIHRSLRFQFTTPQYAENLNAKPNTTDHTLYQENRIEERKIHSNNQFN
ncbi:hypothetical protein NUU61_004638 [Penicillium alfredii]|uniref:RRM domain-containing protein n=1 Tax=Penicillium alfredii TaxID=1506179 RepID=A0A9W9FLH3_9EURO|nr:uncharacterized protein NUU61_004638 [Penicillium alfredii]KAJ5102416.1 hypothetical protein NUU61_004638 [Penicillium alfredii]